MGITTVSVGQYVEQACIQLSERYFAEESIKSSKDKSEVNILQNGGSVSDAAEVPETASEVPSHTKT